MGRGPNNCPYTLPSGAGGGTENCQNLSYAVATNAYLAPADFGNGFGYSNCTGPSCSGNGFLNFNSGGFTSFEALAPETGGVFRDTAEPNGTWLNASTGAELPGSPTIGKGTNLSALCMQNGGSLPNALCSDITGAARPLTGNWDIGAYQSGSTAPPADSDGSQGCDCPIANCLDQRSSIVQLYLSGIPQPLGCAARLIMTPKTSFLNAVKWAYTGNWGERAFSSLFTFILAAVLGPRDFGVVAIALIYIAFLQMFLDQGFMAALIQRKDLEQEHLDAVFWMDVVLSLLLVGVSIVLSGWWAARNHAPEAGKLISVLSLCIPIQGLGAVQSATLSRRLDFRALSIRSNTAVVLSGVVGIGMALAGFRVWALVGQQLTRDFAALVLLWRLSPWRPRLEFSARHLKDLVGFASSNFMAQIAIFAEMQASSVLLGMLFGPVAVGLYRLADRLVSSVVAMATTSIQAVSLPEFCGFKITRPSCARAP